jgi:hypothetical protein
MKNTVRLALVAIVSAGIVSTSQAKPVTSAANYMETIYHDCPKKNGVKECIVSFTKIPAGKVLTVENVNCAVSATNATTGNQMPLKAFLKVADTGTVGTQVALPIGYGGGTSTGYTYVLYAPTFAIVVGGTAGYVPTITTQWSADFDGDMTCTIAGQLGTN